MSVISTPPPNRQPIVTESHVFSEEIIRDAVETELARGGQVYFVHNRVEDLTTMQGLITRICPKARVGVGHGKMPAEQLEKLIMDFIYGEFDVLVADDHRRERHRHSQRQYDHRRTTPRTSA